MFCKVMWYCCILIVEVTLNYYNDFEGQLWTRESEIVTVSEKKWVYKTTSIFKIKKNMDKIKHEHKRECVTIQTWAKKTRPRDLENFVKFLKTEPSQLSNIGL